MDKNGMQNDKIYARKGEIEEEEEEEEEEEQKQSRNV